MQLRALIFDDDSSICSLMERYMHFRGYEALVFSEPKYFECCMCPTGQICADVILCDITMPGISGMEFLERMKARACSVSNFALMSGNCRPEDEARALELGCSVFHKPFRFKELDVWLDECEANTSPTRQLVQSSYLLAQPKDLIENVG